MLQQNHAYEHHDHKQLYELSNNTIRIPTLYGKIFCYYRISVGAELNQRQDGAIVLLQRNCAYEHHNLSASKQQYATV